MLTRRKFLGRFLIGASALVTVAGAETVFLEPRHLVSEPIEVRLKRLPDDFHGFRIAQISDVHFGPYMDKGFLGRAVQLAQSFHPDLLVLTGDFVSHPLDESNGVRGAHYAEPCADVFAMVTGIPVVAILGNHDHWNNGKIVEGALLDRGIKVLRNRSLPLERGRNRIWIAGIDDALVRAADLTKTLRCSRIGGGRAARPRAGLCRLRGALPGGLAAFRTLSWRPGKVAGNRCTDTATHGGEIPTGVEPGRSFAGVHQPRSWRNQPSGAFQLSARGYVCHLASRPAGLTLLSLSLYTQIYSQCRSTPSLVPKWNGSNGKKPERQM